MPEKTVTAPQVTFRQATRHPSTCYPPPVTRHPRKSPAALKLKLIPSNDEFP